MSAEPTPNPLPTGLATAAELRARFDALSTALRLHRDVWGPRPFEGGPLPWADAHPEVVAWLEAQPLDAFDDFDGGWLTTGAPAALQGWAAAARAHVAHPHWPDLIAEPPVTLSVRARRKVPARKVGQIEAFARAALGAGLRRHDTLVDWCAGKGHLGRALCAGTGARLLALEWDPALCALGATRCAQAGVDAEFVCVDVLQPDAAARLAPGHAVVALHACGDLHGALLRAAAARGVGFVALAPCCYNRVGPEPGVALSAAGQAAGLSLSPADLDLVHREQVVAKARHRRQTWQTMAWRLGFDALQRAHLGGEGYRPMPSFSPTWLSLPFPDFCHRLAGLDGLAIPAAVDPAPFEAQGWARLATVRRGDAVRGLFRAALEAWLVLDRALLLVEHGFEVGVATFCARSLSPRNALIIAQRAAGRGTGEP